MHYRHFLGVSSHPSLILNCSLHDDSKLLEHHEYEEGPSENMMQFLL
jgi:hypothetical protein